MNKTYKFLPAMLMVALVFYFTYEAYASMNGRVMRTSTVDGGCGGSGCHGTSSSSNTQLSLQSGSLTVDPSSTNSYKIRVANSGKSQAGVNIAAKTSITGSTNIGSFTAPAGSGLQVMINELAHTSPRDMNGGSFDFEFNWTAPDKPGVYYLRAVGIATNQSGDVSGDEWNWMTPIEITVRGIEIDEPLGGQDFCTGRDLVIRWKSAGIENIKIELSADGGSSWGYTINESFKAVGGSYTWKIPNDFQQGSRFRIRLSDVANPNRKSAMASDFRILGQFSITKHPESKEMCPGESIQLSVVTTGTGLKYQWRKNGSAIVGATDSVYSISSVNSGSNGFYGVIVSSSCFSPIISNESNIQVRIPTSIKKQAKDQAICLGDDAVFEIDVDGQDIKYQWFKGLIAIQGATTPTLTIKTVSSNEVGNYYCEVSGFCGTVKSTVVKLELNEPPKITKQASSQEVCENSTVTISIEASGLNNIYEWYFNDAILKNQSSKSLKIDKASLSNAGDYYCIVKNNCGSPVKSAVASLSIKPLVKITQQPQSRTLMVGDMVELSVKAINAVSYQWRKNIAPIKDANSDILVIESVQLADSGNYDCLITNDCGDVTSIKAKLIVNAPEPGARVNFTSLTIDFGEVFEEKSIDTLLTSFITNIGNEPLIIDSIRVLTADTNNHFVLTFADSTVVEVGDSVNIELNFTPKFPGEKSAVLNIYSNSVGEVPQISLRGSGAFWDKVSNRSKIDFGNVLVGSAENAVFRIFNQSDYDISWLSNSYDCGGTDNYFSLVSPELPRVIKARNNADVEVAFTPAEGNSLDCFMTFNFWGTDKIFKVQLKGVGLGNSVNDESEISDFTVYPNPSSNDLIFDFNIQDSYECSIDIYNTNGKIVCSHTNIIANGTFVWDGRDNLGVAVPSGSYTAILRTSKSNKAINILLIK